MKIVALASTKGGSGKTTTSINLGVALAELKKRVLLIDLDSQAGLTYSFGLDPELTVTDLLRGKASLEDIAIEQEGLKIIPADSTLADFELALTNKTGRESRLNDSLKGVGGFDYIFLDCPPALSIVKINALVACHEILIPSIFDSLGFEGLAKFLDTLEEFRQAFKRKIPITGVLGIMYDKRRNITGEVKAEIQKTLKLKVYKSVIRTNVKVAEAPSFAKSVLNYDSNSNGAEDYRRLAKEFIKGGK